MPASHLTSIEINGTYYSAFKPDSWAKWRDETPDGFVFAVKASRYLHQPPRAGGAGESIERFVGQGMHELRRPARADQLAIHGHQEIRCRGFRGVPETAAARGERPAAAPRAGAPQPDLSGLEILRRRARIQCRALLCRRRRFPGIRRADFSAPICRWSAAIGRASDIVHSHTWYANLAGHLAGLLHGIPHIADPFAGAAAPVEGRAARRRYALSSWSEKVGLEAPIASSRSRGA